MILIYNFEKNVLDETSLYVVGIEVKVHATRHVVVDTWRVAESSVSVHAEIGGRRVEPRASEINGLVNEDVGHPDEVCHARVQADEGFV